MTRLAHFSDFHLQDDGDEFKSAVAMLKDALDEGADHLVISGDIVDYVGMDIYRKFLRKAALWPAVAQFRSSPATTMYSQPGRGYNFPFLGPSRAAV